MAITVGYGWLREFSSHSPVHIFDADHLNYECSVDGTWQERTSIMAEDCLIFLLDLKEQPIESRLIRI